MNYICAKTAIVNPRIVTDELFVLLGLQWPDNFDPNSSIKSNRSVWVTTATFTSGNFGKNNVDDTYVIRLSPKNVNNEIIE